MTKTERRFDALVDEAVRNVRANAGRGEWYEGYKAGASAVAVEFSRLLLRNHDAKAKEPTP
jgi:hypothetical protein